MKRTKADGTPAGSTELQTEAEELLQQLQDYAFGGQPGTAGAPAPACTQQAPLKSIYGSGERTQYQHTFEQTGE